MSLLLDALKQAEENKKEAADAGAISGEVSESIDNADLVLDEIPEGVEPVTDAEISSEDGGYQEIESQAEDQSQDINSINNESVLISGNAVLDPALNVFAAGGKRKQTQKRSKTVIGIVLLGLIVGLAAAYLYTSDNQNDASAEDEFVVAGNETDEVAVQVELTKADKTETVVRKAILLEREHSGADSIEREKVETEQPSGITIKKSKRSSSLSSALSKGYVALQSGRYADAQIIYEQVLNKRPRQTDALLGLANIYAQNNNMVKARRQYEDVLSIEPANKIAQLGLLYSYQSDSSDKGLELLQGLSAKYPNNPDILVAIGHKLAKKSKWAAAQKSYFKAYSAQPNNPVLAYNLGVSLDRMEKYSAAISFYKKALTLNSAKSPAINSQQVKSRLNELGKFND